MSWKYEDWPGQPAPDTAQEEDTLAVSPVEVAHPCPEYVVGAAEASPEEPPAAAFEDEYEAATIDAPAEDTPAEDYSTVDAPPPADEPPATEEMPAEYVLSGRPQAAPEPETVEQTDTPFDFKYHDPNRESTENAEQLHDQAGEMVIVCTSCATMLLIEYNGPCPYTIASLMGSDQDSYSWVLHTICLSCLKRHDLYQRADRDPFSNDYLAVSTQAILSEEFMKQTYCFEIASRACRKPTRIVMDEHRRSVMCVNIDNIREESTSRCRIMGLRSAAERDGKGSRSEIIESFVPGGFM